METYQISIYHDKTNRSMVLEQFAFISQHAAREYGESIAIIIYGMKAHRANESKVSVKWLSTVPRSPKSPTTETNIASLGGDVKGSAALSFDEFFESGRFYVNGWEELGLDGPGWVYADSCYLNAYLSDEAEITAHLILGSQEWTALAKERKSLAALLYLEHYLREVVR